jgi:GR25 family glycosyltransferase involved in LPS biosynthesis
MNINTMNINTMNINTMNNIYDTTPPNLSNIKSLVLTLPDYSSRLPKLDKLLQNFEKIGLNPELFNGVHGKDIVINSDVKNEMETITWRDITYNYNKNIRLNGQRMLLGEFGCLWSHINIFKDLLSLDCDGDKYYLVIEDDAELVKPIDELQELLLHLPEDMDFCHLAYSQWYPFLLTTQKNNYFYECEKRFFNSCVAYIVSRKGAKKILDYIGNEFNMPIDDIINTIYCTQPDFKFYVPQTFFFKEQDNTVSVKLSI